jgi:thioredoxin-like negative regulator of GroEL
MTNDTFDAHTLAITTAMKLVADVAKDVRDPRYAIGEADVEHAVRALEDALDAFAVWASDDHTDCVGGLEKALVYALDDSLRAKRERGE